MSDKQNFELKYQKRFDELRNIINKRLTEYSNSQINQGLLFTAFDYTIIGDGKRIRPILTMLSSAICSNGSINSIYPDTVLGSAMAIEILHNFTLIHDDLMDQSPIRHQRPTVHQKFNSDIAILTGDLMVGLAFNMLLDYSNNENNINKKLVNTLSDALIEVCLGQELDIKFNSNSKVTTDDYLLMIEKKTSSLFRCSVKLGAISVNANQLQIDALDSFALNIGRAFQIQDDILDFTAANIKFGKKIGQDVLEHKKTFPIIKAKELATEQSDVAFINNYFNSLTKPDDSCIEKFIDIFNRLKILNIAASEVEKYFNEAKHYLKLFDNSDNKSFLLWVVDNLLHRSY